MAACSKGCDRPALARKLCARCYHAAIRNGDIVSCRPRQKLADVFWGRVDKGGPIVVGMKTPCWIWMGARDGHHGYGHVWLQGRRAGWAHRVAWTLVRGEPPDGLWVLHRCDNPACVRPSHLFLGDVRANAEDMIRKRRGIWQGSRADEWRAKVRAAYRGPVTPLRGEASPRAKLTDDAVRKIRAERARGVPLKVLAARYGVSIFAVSRAANRQLWTHVE
jgi:hypothetical protein